MGAGVDAVSSGSWRDLRKARSSALAASSLDREVEDSEDWGGCALAVLSEVMEEGDSSGDAHSHPIVVYN